MSRRNREADPTWRMGPTSGSSTSATHPSAMKNGSESASAGERMRETPKPTTSAAFTQASAGKLLEGGRQVRVLDDALEQTVVFHRDPVGVPAVGEVDGCQRGVVPFRRPQDPVGPERPVVHPASVGTFEDALDGPGVQGPHPVQGRVGSLHPLPVQGHGGQGTLQQRGGHPLAGAGHLSRPQGCGDAQGGQVGRPHARPRRSGEDGSGSVGATHHPLGTVELRQGTGPAEDVLHGGAPSALLVIEQTGPCRDQGIEGRTVAVAPLLAVARDRTGDEAGVARRQLRVVHAEPGHGARRKAVQDDVGLSGEREEGRSVGVRVQVEARAALPPVPYPVTRLDGERVTLGRFDAGHGRAVVRQQHGRHRTGHPPREIQDMQTVEYSRHDEPPGKGRPWAAFPIVPCRRTDIP